MLKQEENNDPVAQVKQAEVKKGKVFKGRFTLKPGHKIWEIDLNTGLCVEATYEKDANVEFETGRTIRSIIQKENCVYLPALNSKNALKKFNKIVNKVK